MCVCDILMLSISQEIFIYLPLVPSAQEKNQVPIP